MNKGKKVLNEVKQQFSFSLPRKVEGDLRLLFRTVFVVTETTKALFFDIMISNFEKLFLKSTDSNDFESITFLALI
jgi:hypothetical protein